MEPVDPLPPNFALPLGSQPRKSAVSGLGDVGESPMGVSVFHCRVLLIADSAGVNVMNGTVAVDRSMADRIESIARGAITARFVFADSRILEQGHNMAGLLPPVGSRSAARGKWFVASEKPTERDACAILRRLAPWVAAIATAGIGFLAFLHRAA